MSTRFIILPDYANDIKSFKITLNSKHRTEKHKTKNESTKTRKTKTQKDEKFYQKNRQKMQTYVKPY